MRVGTASNIWLWMTLSTYEGSTMGAFHPVSWYQELENGRSFYTAMGHTDESYQEELSLYHILGGIL